MLINLIVVIMALFLFVIILSSWNLSNKVLHPKRVCLDKSMHIENKSGRFLKEKYDKLNKEDLSIKSSKGYDLSATLIFRKGINKNNIIKEKEKIIIFAHGYEYNRIGSVKYFDIFMKRDFNILIYDHRNSGSSGGNTTTMGKEEKQDLKTIINEMRKIFGQDSIIGVHGESMGASTALLTLEIEDEINFIISDCGYSNLKDELAYQLKKQYRLYSFPFLNIASIFTKLRAGYKYEDINPIDIIKKYGLKVPILFIHGDKDNFTPCSMTEEMYEERIRSVDKNICTMKYIAKDSDHTESYWNNKEEYDRVVGEFLRNI